MNDNMWKNIPKPGNGVPPDASQVPLYYDSNGDGKIDMIEYWTYMDDVYLKDEDPDLYAEIYGDDGNEEDLEELGKSLSMLPIVLISASMVLALIVVLIIYAVIALSA